jgi:phosphatidylserine/phosphatidylglycerophosphate/cardiolipin synthase-like enzyme
MPGENPDLPPPNEGSGRLTPGTPSSVDLDPENWYSVFFTDPLVPGAESFRGGPDASLAEAIDQARLSVEVATDDFDLWSLRDALIAAHRRGVVVRVVAESDNLSTPELQALMQAGIPVVGDRSEGLMHNKYVIIDRWEVWTGSMNFTLSGAYKSNNNLIRLRSPQLAENYLVEFAEMFDDERFGPGSPANTPYPSLSIEGTPVETFVSPDDGTAQELIRLIQGAQESIYILAYSFTSDDIASAILSRARAGVEVVGVFDESQYQSNEGTEFDRMLENGLDIRLDGNSRSMHHKVIIIDEKIVITGSYNFSNNAETRNDENTLVIHNPQITARYTDEFNKVFQQAHRK